MENQGRVVEIIHPSFLEPEIQLVFDRKETGVYNYEDVVSVRMSKELAEKYLAQLRSALEDLDRAEDGLIKQERRVKKDERII